MRPTLRAEGPLEHLALWFNLGPVPTAEAMFGMGTSRVLMAGVSLGLFAALAESPASAEEISRQLSLDVAGVRHVLECLAALSHLRRTGEMYALTARARRWLDPASPTYIGEFLEFNYDQWEWWSHLEDVVRTGRSFGIHDCGPEDPRWGRYIRAMFALARLAAPEVARHLRLPPRPGRLLDLAGGHGWYAAELCRRHPTLHATVLDLPGSARVGREIIAKAGMSDRVRHVEGDMMQDDLGGPYDGALCFQIIHHLSPEENRALLRRVCAALAPGGTLAVLDYFAPPTHRKPDSSAFLGLHFYLTSHASTYTPKDLQNWLRETGFSQPRRVPVQRIPLMSLYEAHRAG